MEAPDRVLRLWSLLNAAADDFHLAGVAPGVVPRLQRLVEAVVAELERSVSPALAGELRHLVRPGQVPVSAAELRIEYVSLLGWMSGLVIEILGQLEAARPARQRDRLGQAEPDAGEYRYRVAQPVTGMGGQQPADHLPVRSPDPDGTRNAGAIAGGLADHRLPHPAPPRPPPRR